MTSSKVNNIPVYDFSDDKPATEVHPEPKIAEKDILKDAIAKAEAALAAKSAKRPLVKSKASKLPSTKRGKAGRVVGISADENAFLKKALQLIANSDAMLQTFVESGKFEEAFDKLQARYNK